MAQHLSRFRSSVRPNVPQHLSGLRRSSSPIETGFAATAQMSKGSPRRATDSVIMPVKGSIVETFPRGRVCSDERCDTMLSIYNSTDFCSVHTQPVKWVVKHRL